MTILEAINQLKLIRRNLEKSHGPYVSQKTIEFKAKSIEAIDVVLRELEGDR